MHARRSRDELLLAVTSAGFFPALADVLGLLELMGTADDAAARQAAKALARLGDKAVEIARERWDGASSLLRARLCELVGRVGANQAENAVAVAWLCERLADGDPRVRRRAATGLGKLGGAAVLDALTNRWREEPEAGVRRVLAEALGKRGDAATIAELSAPRAEPNETILGRTVRQAVQRLERSLLREEEPTVLDASAHAPGRIRALLHVRAGLERVLLDELDRNLEGQVVAPGRVGVFLSGPLKSLWRCRTMLHFGFPLGSQPIRRSSGSADAAMIGAVADALTSEEALAIFRTWTRGPIRYRLEWTAAGHRRAATFDAAEAVSRARPELVNDAVDAPWQVVVSEKRGSRGPKIAVELWPVGLRDPRFTYRVRGVSAASHPTLAAAIARVGEARHDDVVWDPFVGSGLELIERGLLGAYQQLIGTDVAKEAIEAAQANVEAAGLRAVDLAVADSTEFRPAIPVTLVLANPPFGRRNPVGTSRDELLKRVLTNATGSLEPGGRFVWVSPAAEETARAATKLGLTVGLRQKVDVGGFTAELQRFDKPGGRATQRP